MISINEKQVRDVYKDLFELNDSHRLLKLNTQRDLLNLISALFDEDWKEAQTYAEKILFGIIRIKAYEPFKDNVNRFSADQEDIQSIIDEII